MKKDKKDLILDSTEKLMCIMPDSEITINMIAKNARILIGQVNKQFGKIRKARQTECINSAFKNLTQEEMVIVSHDMA